MYYSAISHMIHERTPRVSQRLHDVYCKAMALFSCFGVKKVGVLVQLLGSVKL